MTSPIVEGLSPAAGSDCATIDSIISALYDVISGPVGSRDWPRMRALFHQDARLVRRTRSQDGDFRLDSSTVGEFIAQAAPALEKTPFYEQEISRRTHAFGAIAQVFSVYGARLSLDEDAPIMRGINSIQLVQHDDRWWVVNLLWDDERDDCPIGAELLA
jgi:hypothetical protein